MRREIVSWDDIDRLIDNLVVQFDHEFEAMVMITRGGIVPGGMLAESMGITDILTAAVDFPAEIETKREKLLVWPQFIQFPDDGLMRGRRILVVDDVWGSGRTSTAVKNRVSAAGGMPFTCVLHFNPHRNLFGSARPDYFAASTDAYIVYPWEVDRGSDRILKDY
ncbi:MAG: phosphoribosyltransferase [Anaerolineae bacterium]|nr:phosphoribosyltransferase [Anaerolineae bacterium]